jgi:prepilin peptidase CpaA
MENSLTVTALNVGILLLLLSVILIVAVVTDLRSQKIPNWLTFPSMLLAVGLYTSHMGIQGMLFSLEGVAVGIGVLFIPYLMGGMGAGDSKLMGAIGGLLGPKMVFIAFLFTAIIGGCYALLVIIHQGSLKSLLSQCWAFITLAVMTRQITGLPGLRLGEAPRLRYGIAIALGTLLSVFMTDNPLSTAVKMVSL